MTTYNTDRDRDSCAESQDLAPCDTSIQSLESASDASDPLFSEESVGFPLDTTAIFSSQESVRSPIDATAIFTSQESAGFPFDATEITPSQESVQLPCEEIDESAKVMERDSN